MILTGVPLAHPILSPQIPSLQTTESRKCQKQSFNTIQSQQSSHPQPHSVPDTSNYSLESMPNDSISNADKQIALERNNVTEQSSKRITRCTPQTVQTVQSALKSPSKSPGKSPRQMEIVRQKSESLRGRSRGARSSSVARGSTRIPSISSRGRGRGRAPLVVPIGKSNLIYYQII